MSSNAEYVIATPEFEKDCAQHQVPLEDLETVRTMLMLNPEYGASIKFAASREGRLACAQLRVMPWAYPRNGDLAKGNILYVYITQDFPIFLLRFEIDDGRGLHGPFVDPLSWPKWAERIGELIELATHAWT